MRTVVVRRPAAVGAKLTVKVPEEPIAMEVGQPAVMLKSPELPPETVMLEMLRAEFPLLKMVNVLEKAVVEKSVWSPVEGVASPSEMSVALPFTFISGWRYGEQLVPVVTPPGVTQLEVAPLRAKLVSVPLLPLAVASVSALTGGVVLSAPAKP